MIKLKGKYIYIHIIGLASTPLCHNHILIYDILLGSSRLCNWLALWCLVPWINYLPHVCCSTFWKLVLNNSWFVSSGSPQVRKKEKVEILKSQEKVSKFWYVSGNFEIHQNVRRKSGKMDLISIWRPHFIFWLSMSWCGCSVSQLPTRYARKSGNVFP